MADDEDHVLRAVLWVAAIAALGCVVLVVAYYARHSERSFTADFGTKRTPATITAIDGSDGATSDQNSEGHPSGASVQEGSPEGDGGTLPY